MCSRETRASARCRWSWPIVLAMLVFPVAGCGGPAYEYDAVVTGTVTIDGELAKSGTVTFHPLDEEGKVAIGRIYPDGSFAMRTGQGDLRESDGGTVVPGQYIVTVLVTGPPPPDARTAEGGPPMAGPRLMHSKYGSKETSDLQRTVQRGRNVFDLRLEGAERETAVEDATPTESTDETKDVEAAEVAVDAAAAGVANDVTDDQAPDDGAAERQPPGRSEEANP